MQKNNYDKAFPEIMKQFQGLKKIEAFDIISKLEMLIFHAPNPLQFKDIDDKKFNYLQNINTIDPFHFTILPNGNFAELIGNNNFIYIYKEYRNILSKWSFLDTYYFTSKYFPTEFTKLTKKKILMHFEGKEEEQRIKSFIDINKASKTNPLSGKLLILDV